MSAPNVAIVGAGPYGLSLAAHLSARGIPHRIFGEPMSFWVKIAEAGGERFLKSYCFGTNISNPTPGFDFADYSEPRGLETFEPCTISDFAAYGLWFQGAKVAWVENANVVSVSQPDRSFAVTLDTGESFAADKIIFATGLSYFAHVPKQVASLPPAFATHTGAIKDFAAFKDREIAVVGAGQSALEAAALLHEAGAKPLLLVQSHAILWQTRVFKKRSLWALLRSPISGLGTGPKAWALTTFPGAMHRFPESFRKRFVKRHLPPEGAWWLRDRVENCVPIRYTTSIVGATEADGRVALKLRNASDRRDTGLTVDHVVAGTGYRIDVDRLDILKPELRASIRRIGTSPKLNAQFESSVPGLHFIGPASAMSFGPLFRFVVGAEYTARILAAHLVHG